MQYHPQHNNDKVYQGLLPKVPLGENCKEKTIRKSLGNDIDTPSSQLSGTTQTAEKPHKITPVRLLACWTILGAVNDGHLQKSPYREKSVKIWL